MRRTLDCVAAQTVRPALWVVIDDGSTDATPEILAEYAARLDFLRVIRREDRGDRSVGPGVVDAFYTGLETVDLDAFAYVCKLDMDLDLRPRYFERLMEMMEADPRLGSASGKPYFRSHNGRMVPEVCGDEMSVGMTKFYHTTCFQQIGGFVRRVMWDGIDCHRCRMLGWKAGSFDEPELRFEHLRPMGSSQKGILTGRMRHGYGQYFMGTGLAYITASALFRIGHPPRVIGAAVMWWGYVRSLLRREPRYEDREFRAFLRRYQWRSLLRGKSGAVRQIDQQQSAVWSPHRHDTPSAENSLGSSTGSAMTG